MKSHLFPLVLALAISGGGLRAQQNTTDDYPNTSPGTPLSILADGTASVNGRINFADDKDVLSFQVGNNGGVTIYTTGTTDTNGVLRRQTSTGWITVASDEGTPGNFRISRILDPGLYSIQVTGKLENLAGTVGGAYTLRLDIAPPTPPAPPDIDVDVARGGSIGFGAIAVGTSVSKAVTIRNTGASTLQVTGISLTGANTPAGGGLIGGPFFLEGSNGRAIAPGASSTFHIIFRPTAVASYTALVSIASNDPDENPWSFTLTGTGAGTPPPPPGAPEIAVALGQLDIESGGTVDFGTVPVPGTNSVVVRELLISNTGDADLHLGIVKILPPPTASPVDGAPDGFFRVLTAPAEVVPPGRNTVLRIGAGGATTLALSRYTMQATIGNDDSDENPYRLILAATVNTPPPPVTGEIAVFSGNAEIQDDGTLDLGTTSTGTPLEKTVTIKNTGTGELRLNSIGVEWAGPIIAIWPPPPLPFRVEGVEPRTVAPGAYTNCRVIFPATTPGVAEANLVIASTDADENPFTILLTAKAEGDPVPPAAPEIAVSMGDQELPMGGAVDFGRTSLTVPVKKTITISNRGTATLIVRSAIQPVARGGNLISLPFRFTGEPVTKVEPGASKGLSIIFQPLVNGSYQAALVMANNDSDENPYRLKLVGQGGTDPAALPDIALSLGDTDLPQGGVVDFGEVVPGTSVTKEVRIRNTGTGDLRLGRISFQSSATPVPGDPAGGVNNVGADGNVIIQPPVGALPFRVLPPPNNVVPAGGSAVLRVVYMAPPSGSSEAVLVIESNDPDENPYRLTLKGKSTGTAPSPPDIAVKAGDAELPRGGTLDFGVVVIGAPVRREITVANTGGGDLRIHGFSILPAEFFANDALIWTPPNALVRVVSGPGIIAAGGQGTFVLEMMGFMPGEAKLQARISNNDPDENPYSFSITGEVQAPPVEPQPPTPVGGALQ